MRARVLKVAHADEEVIVDDVVTRGSTLLGAASLLTDVLSCRKVSAFAAVRTMSELEDVPAMVAPAVGTITHRRGQLVREP
jgi:adenine/guanine phosphoribosyltransferase-like PRPP-binding protein